jgi:hypothetical protein
MLEELIFGPGDLLVLLIAAGTEFEQGENEVTVEVRNQSGEQIVLRGDLLGGLRLVRSSAAEQGLSGGRDVGCHDVSVKMAERGKGLERG